MVPTCQVANAYAVLKAVVTGSREYLHKQHGVEV